MKTTLYKSFNSKEAQEVTLEQVYEMIHSDEELKKSTQLHRDLWHRAMIRRQRT